MKLNQLFRGFGLQKRTPRKKIEARQNLLNQLRERGTENENILSEAKKNPLENLVETIKTGNKSEELKKSLLQRLTTGKRR